MENNDHMRVLYVDDDADSFEMLQVMLAPWEIHLESAGSVAAALIQAGREKFDLYLLDNGLPDGTGFELCRTLRALDPKVPVLFYTGNAYADDIKMGMAAGADGYIIKPHSEKLAETIIQLVTAQVEKQFVLVSLPVFTASASA